MVESKKNSNAEAKLEKPLLYIKFSFDKNITDVEETEDDKINISLSLTINEIINLRLDLDRIYQQYMKMFS